jgi:tyrosyl-tRNA synthetase
MGREIMQHYGLPPQSVITYELLVGTDGVEKMSKSQGNYVGIDEAPEEMFGKVMSIPDAALDQWWRLTLDREPPGGDPMQSKLALARGIVELYHDAGAAQHGEDHFTRVVREGSAPENVSEAVLAGDGEVHLPALLVEHLGVGSTSEARRLIAQGAVKVNGEVTSDLDVPLEALDGALVQAGKRRFMRFRVA